MASELRVNTITSTTGVGTVSFNTGGVSFSGSPSFSNISVNSINFNPISGIRNKIINGNFDIWQRGTISTGRFGALTYVADRFGFESWTSTTARVTYERVLDAPPISETVGFSSYSARITVTTTGTNPTNDFGVLRQFIEGYNAQDLYQRPFVISFWVKSSLVGTYALSIYGGGASPGQSPGTPGFSQTYTINSANTWEYKTIQVPACPAGTYSNWDFGNGRGMDFIWRLWSNNATYVGSLGSWSTASGYPFPSGNYVNFSGTNGATWQISQVQVEPGTVATPFERRFYAQELALCQRYYQVLTIGPNSYGAQYSNNGNFYGHPITLPIQMRVPSTSTTYVNLTGANYWVHAGQTAFSANSTAGINFNAYNNSVSMTQVRQAGNSVPTGNSYYVMEASFQILLSSEL